MVGAGTVLGRYVLFEPIAAGGMASICLGRQAGAAGFSRVVAVKRLHPHMAQDPEFIAMFLDEARLAARVRHPNVIETLDVVHEGKETFIVMEYVDGEALAKLIGRARARGERVPVDIACAIVLGLLRGLHAAHEARGPSGEPLGIVHRDVSPQNVLVGTDGVARAIDFGIALANVKLHTTRAGEVKGKVAYMSPEQLRGEPVTRAADLYAAGVVLWELCAGRRAYDVENEGALYARVLTGSIPRIDEVAPWVSPQLASVVGCAIARQAPIRFATAQAMVSALESVVTPAPPSRVGAWVDDLAQEELVTRRAIVARIEHAGAGGTSASPALASTRGAIPSSPNAIGTSLAARAQLPSHFGADGDPHGRGTHTLTAAAPAVNEPSRQRSMVIAAAAVTFGAVIAAGTMWLAMRRPADAASPRPTDDVHATEVATTDGAASPDASATAIAATSETVAAVTTTTATAAESAASSSTSTSISLEPATSARSRPRSQPSATSTTGPCDPPTYIDAQGIRRVKRECF